jgi:glycosyltransferase involved in cell wall biosynthesis
MNVGLFIASLDAGGTEGQMLQLATRLDPRRFQVRLACFSAQGAFAARARAQLCVTEFPLVSLRHPGTVVELLRFAAWCRRQELSVVHTAGLYANVFGTMGAALAGVRLRVASRRCLANLAHPPTLRRLERLTYRLAHRVATNSSAAARILAREGVASDAITIIPNGIDLTGRPVCAAAGAAKVIVVANFRREKGHDVLLDAAPHVLAARRDVIFRIVGDGPLRRAIEADTHRRGLGRSFEFLGCRSDVPDLLRDAGVFVLPSKSDARPNALMEAMAAGLPVVATAVGDVPELIDANRTGVLVPPGNPHALVAAILSILDDPVWAAALGAAARLAMARFNVDRMVAAYERLYVEGVRTSSDRAVLLDRFNGASRTLSSPARSELTRPQIDHKSDCSTPVHPL